MNPNLNTTMHDSLKIKEMNDIIIKKIQNNGEEIRKLKKESLVLSKKLICPNCNSRYDFLIEFSPPEGFQKYYRCYECDYKTDYF